MTRDESPPTAVSSEPNVISPNKEVEEPPAEILSSIPSSPDAFPQDSPGQQYSKSPSDPVERMMLKLHGEDSNRDLKTPVQPTKEVDELEELTVKPAPVKVADDAITSPNKVGIVSKRLAFAQKSKTRTSKTKRAGLVFAVPRIQSRLKRGRYARRVEVTASVYLAAVLEYLVAEVLELAGNCTRYFKKKRVFPRCIQLTFLHDKELEQLTRGAIVPQGGVRPNIHPTLLGAKEGAEENAIMPANQARYY